SLAGRDDVIRPVEIALVDLVPRHESVDVDRVRALDLDRRELVVVDRHVLALADLVAAPLVRGVDRIAALLVDHQLAQAMARPGVDLVEMRLLGLRRRRKELDRAGHEREAKVSFPVGTRHAVDPMGTRPGDDEVTEAGVYTPPVHPWSAGWLENAAEASE